MPQPGLDAAFLEYIRDPDPEARRRIHGNYVSLFDDCGSVVDLACGDGEFVGLLAEAGLRAWGIDADPGNVAGAVEAGRDVVQADVADWLAGRPDESVGGIFNSHLVEHLEYEAVLSLYGECHRVLEPGGKLVTVTPNVRAIYSHLEMFYQHFGHVTFYHPRLLAFFAHQVGFAGTEQGENPALSTPMFGPREPTAPTQDLPPEWEGPLRQPRYDPNLPQKRGPIAGAWWRLKMAAAKALVRPYLDPMVEDLHVAIAAANAEHRRLDALVRRAVDDADLAKDTLDEVVSRLDRSLEVYVISTKGPEQGEPVGAGNEESARA